MVNPPTLRASLDKVREQATINDRAEGASIRMGVLDDDSGWARATGIATVGRNYHQDLSSIAAKYLFVAAEEEHLNGVIGTSAEHVFPHFKTDSSTTMDLTQREKL